MRPKRCDTKIERKNKNDHLTIRLAAGWKS